MIEKEIQIDTMTKEDRYPEAFGAARQFVENGLGKPAGTLRILSFGCSTGEELSTLSRYFPGAQLFGCDIKPEVVAAAQARLGDKATVFVSSEVLLNAHGPFDLIFAMSVFCVHGDGRKDILQVLPFSRFEESLNQLVRHGTSDLLLVMNNTSYFIQETNLWSEFCEIRHPDILENSFVDRYSRDHRLLAQRHQAKNWGFYRARPDAGPIPDSYFANALFFRRAGDAGKELTMSRRRLALPAGCDAFQTVVHTARPDQPNELDFPMILTDESFRHDGKVIVRRTSSRRSLREPGAMYQHAQYEWASKEPLAVPTLDWPVS